MIVNFKSDYMATISEEIKNSIRKLENDKRELERENNVDVEAQIRKMLGK